MYLLGLLSCVLFAIVTEDAVAENYERLKLKWPIKYTFEAEKISLTAGLVEDFRFWRTKYNSRVDYNDGAVKYISVKPHRKIRFGVKYELYPETTEEKENYIVCKRTNGTRHSHITLDEILPHSYEKFDYVGSETFDQFTMDKFHCYEEDDEHGTEEIIWAAYKPDKNYWVPIRYETIKYEMWTGIKKAHSIMNIQNFDTHFNSTIVFKVENLNNCRDTETEQDDELSNSHSDNISPESKSHVDYVFNSFKKDYNKVYANKKEHFLRRNIFEKTLEIVNENNNKDTRYKLAINKFADRTPEEMTKYRGLVRPSQRESDTHPFPYTRAVVRELSKNLPLEFDLRDLGAITPVKDQEECGSCWTFGTTSAVEGALARKNGGRLIRLSNQVLLDCAWGYNTSGCDGGNDVGAYRWMIDHGLPSEEEYGPYTNKDGFCHIHNMTNIYPIRGFTNVTPYSVEALKVALVNHGPVSVSIHATDILFLYKSGIYYDIDCDPNKLNHEVTLVGYGQRDGEEYWIVKNSWGQVWGIDGYFHISVRDNNCGITTEPSYPVV